MKSRALLFWLAFTVICSTAYGTWWAWRQAQNRAVVSRNASTTHVVAHKLPPEGPPIKDFQLTERSGREFDSKELAGKVWIGSFFFASCPGSCWQMNQALNKVRQEITDPDLRFVSITCDPENDTPEALRAYADRFGADRAQWLFLTGELPYIQRIGRDVFFQDIQKATHTFRALVIDRAGKVRGSFDMLDPVKVTELKTLVQELLQEKPPAEKAS